MFMETPVHTDGPIPRLALSPTAQADIDGFVARRPRPLKNSGQEMVILNDCTTRQYIRLLSSRRSSTLEEDAREKERKGRPTCTYSTNGAIIKLKWDI